MVVHIELYTGAGMRCATSDDMAPDTLTEWLEAQYRAAYGPHVSASRVSRVAGELQHFGYARDAFNRIAEIREVTR